MKKIVLYTIGALCLLGQNGIGSTAHPTGAIPSMGVNQIGESEPKKPSEEMIKVSKKIIPYITLDS